MSELIQIGRFYDTTQAHIARGILETHDIPCFIFDESHTSSAWHMNIAIGGARLMIHKSDYNEAIQCLAEFEEINAETIKETKPLIRKPYLKTFFGTLLGFIVGAPSIWRDKKRKD